MKPFISIAAAVMILAACDNAASVASSLGVAPAVATASASPAAAMCAESVLKEVSLSAPDAKDVYQLSAIGADCKEAILLTTVRTATGTLLWSHADVARDTMAFAGLEPGKTPAQALHELMVQWAEISEAAPTSDAPEWKEGAPRPEVESGLYIGTALSRDEYQAFRTGTTRTLCHPVYLNRTLCVAFTPNGDGTGSATELFDMRS